jgi:hypothetical protein
MSSNDSRVSFFHWPHGRSIDDQIEVALAVPLVLMVPLVTFEVLEELII